MGEIVLELLLMPIMATHTGYSIEFQVWMKLGVNWYIHENETSLGIIKFLSLLRLLDDE